VTAVEEIKARVDIVDLIGETVRLRRSGKNYTGFCPFHANVHTPSFAVFPDSGTWRCFGACNEGGDVFRFVMKKEGCDFPEALRALAERAGIELHARTPDDLRAEEEHARLRTLLELAETFFRNTLQSGAGGAKVLEYLHHRGLSDSTLEAFGVGLAPAGWDGGITFFRSKEYADGEMQEAGLAVEREGGGLRDRFHNRIMIPIRDASGKLCGFGARIVNPDDQPKFINSPQSPLFDKGRLLFGLDRASRAIRAAGEAVLVEGYLDVMAAHQAGFENVISPMGTALTENQLRIIKRYAKRFILALDSDAAGNSATLRGLEIAQKTLQRVGPPEHSLTFSGEQKVIPNEESYDHIAKPSFDVRGLIQFERTLQADLRVASLPPGKDPDEVVLESAEEWRKIIADAQPVVLHVLHTLIEGQNLNDPKVKAGIAARMLPLIEDVGDRVEQDAYRQQVARTLRLNERALAPAAVTRPLRRRGRAGTVRPAERTEGTIPAGGRMEVQEAYNLGLLFRQPDQLFRIDRSFAEMKLDRIGAEDFTEPAFAALIDLVRGSLLEEDAEEYFASHIPEDLRGALTEAMGAFRKYHGEEAASAEEALEAMLRLRQRTLDRQLADLRFYLMEVEQPASGMTGEDDLNVARHGALERINRISDSMRGIDRALMEQFQSGVPRLTLPRPPGIEVS
jgi:DNA primase